MQIGLVLPHWTGAMGGETPSADQVVEFGRKAEESGIDSLWLTDHIYHESYIDFEAHGYELPDDYRGFRNGFWECWTLLAAIAAVTDRVTIGTLVTNTSFRNPALLANMVETVDSLSINRLVLGLGAGDFYSEHLFHGFPWERRVSRFEEALQILIPMLRGERVSHDGEFYTVQTAEVSPRASEGGRVPILIGSMQGGPRMQRLTAEYADGWTCWLAFENSYARNFATRKQVSEEALASRGRNPDQLRTSVVVGVVAPGAESLVPGAVPISGSAHEVAAELETFAELGVDDLCVLLYPASDAGLAWFSEVLEDVRDRVPGAN